MNEILLLKALLFTSIAWTLNLRVNVREKQTARIVNIKSKQNNIIGKWTYKAKRSRHCISCHQNEQLRTQIIAK